MNYIISNNYNPLEDPIAYYHMTGDISNKSEVPANITRFVDEITIPSELFNSINNSANKSFQKFTDLYNKIMEINLSDKFKFNFEGKTESDYGRLTKYIFEKLLLIYTHRFFESVKSNNDFIILKKFEDMPEPTPQQLKNKKQKDILYIETKQMIILAKAAGTKIFLRIHPVLLALLQSDNYMDYFNNSKNLYDFANSANTALLVNNNSKNIIQRFKESKNNITKNGLKREIRLRRFAIVCGFTTWEQFEKMQLFIQRFWDHQYFTSDLKFYIESFLKILKVFYNSIKK